MLPLILKFLAATRAFNRESGREMKVVAAIVKMNDVAEVYEGDAVTGLTTRLLAPDPHPIARTFGQHRRDPAESLATIHVDDSIFLTSFTVWYLSREVMKAFKTLGGRVQPAFDPNRSAKEMHGIGYELDDERCVKSIDIRIEFADVQRLRR